ncbi:MAG: ABC transporter substrate-binding protein [Caldilineaceae bacterium]|nr:ABC transporter substrate-binding protein [Caldilineaceae bacterium]
MYNRKFISRREFMRLSAFTAVGVTAAACAQSSGPGAAAQPTAETQTAASGGEAAASSGGYKEAPMLADLVQQGKLPPVEERLPPEPVVIEPYESAGQYGGTWHGVIRTANESLYGELSYEPMLRYAMGGQEILPNVAERWEEDDEAKVFTFYMRQGIKWSDGQPLTADDVVFWFEDMVSNEELFPAFPVWLTAGGERCTLEKVDDYTVRFVFNTPAPFFIRQIAYPWNEAYRPRHFLEQFHVNYADEAELNQKIADGGYETWVQLFLAKEDWDVSLDVPVIFGWINETLDTNQRTAVRNPYYWKVDPEGNQLPYIDRHVGRMASDTSVAQLMAFSGEVDYTSFAVGQFPRDTMTLKRSEEQGNYHVIPVPISEPNVFILAFNLNHKDPVLREVFNDRRFRIGLSYAINREEIRNLIYLDQPKESRQVAPLPESPYYHEAAAKNYTEYDVDQANAMLDDMGLTERDANGIRLRPDGAPLAVTLEVMGDRDDFVDALELIAGWWKAVGVDTSVKAQERTLYQTRISGGEIDAGVYFSGAGLFVPLAPDRMIPIKANCLWAPAWGLWYATRGESGEEPPAEVKQQLEWYDEMLLTPTLEGQQALWNQIMDVNAENLYHMGICDRAAVPCTVSNRMRNVPETGWDIAWEAGTVSTTNTCQWYMSA